MANIIFSNDVKLSVDSVDGVKGVDENNILASVISSPWTDLTYIATEDCYYMGTAYSAGGAQGTNVISVTLNGVAINPNYNTRVVCVYLKKGDTITIHEQANPGYCSYIAIGLK